VQVIATLAFEDEEFTCRILPTSNSIFFIAKECDDKELLYAEFTYAKLEKYLEENFGVGVDEEDVSKLIPYRVTYDEHDDGKYRFYFGLAREPVGFVEVTPLVDYETFIKLYATLDKKLQNDTSDVEEKYDNFYKHMITIIDDVLSLWEDTSSLSHNDRTNWAKRFGKDYTKENFKNNMFWWKSRNEYIETEKRKELKRKFEEQRTAATEHKQQTERRKKGLLFVRQVQK
jgi:hypothetical protein